MREKALVMTKWLHAQPEGNVPNLGVVHDFSNEGDRIKDVSAAPSSVDPNTYVVYIECEDTTMDAIEADPNFDIMPETREPV